MISDEATVVESISVFAPPEVATPRLMVSPKGIVIGETIVIEGEVSILQSVILGATGEECDDRPPKIRIGVLLSVGAKVVGHPNGAKPALEMNQTL